MARTHARWKVEAWEPDSDFRKLDRDAQWLYMALVSQPQINNVGVLPFAPRRWSQLSADGSVRATNGALRALSEQKYVVFDERTRELLVRSFVRHDQIWKQPNLVKSARKQYREVESDTIRCVLAAEYPWLSKETAQPSGDKPKGVRKPLSEGVNGRPSGRGSGRGSTRVRARDHAGASPTPSPTPLRRDHKAAADQKRSPTTEARPPDEPPTPAAALEDQHPPRQHRIREVAQQLDPHDPDGCLRNLEPLAAQTTSVEFEEAVARVAQRRRVRNPAGLLITFLEQATAQRQATADAELATKLTAIQDETKAEVDALHAQALADIRANPETWWNDTGSRIPDINLWLDRFAPADREPELRATILKLSTRVAA